MVLAVMAIIGFGAYAFAGWGMGYGHHGRGHYGPDYHHEGWGGSGYGHMMDDLSDVDIEKLDQKHLYHMIQVRKINPDAGRGYRSGMDRGFGGGYC